MTYQDIHFQYWSEICNILEQVILGNVEDLGQDYYLKKAAFDTRPISSWAIACEKASMTSDEVSEVVSCGNDGTLCVLCVVHSDCDNCELNLKHGRCNNCDSLWDLFSDSINSTSIDKSLKYAKMIRDCCK